MYHYGVGERGLQRADLMRLLVAPRPRAASGCAGKGVPVVGADADFALLDPAALLDDRPRRPPRPPPPLPLHRPDAPRPRRPHDPARPDDRARRRRSSANRSGRVLQPSPAARACSGRVGVGGRAEAVADDEGGAAQQLARAGVAAQLGDRGEHGGLDQRRVAGDAVVGRADGDRRRRIARREHASRPPRPTAAAGRRATTTTASAPRSRAAATPRRSEALMPSAQSSRDDVRHVEHRRDRVRVRAEDDHDVVHPAVAQRAPPATSPAAARGTARAA